MKYKAKYLPVEGEIKQGNKYFASDGTLCERYTSKDVEGDRLAKLFLISTDIKVGDKVLSPVENEFREFTIVEKPKGYNLNMMVGVFTDGRPMTEPAYLNQNTFKIIGEISPEATFVKEGDEFDEEQVAYCYSVEDNPDEFILLMNFEYWVTQHHPSSRKNLRKYKGNIHIKCPTCGTFH